MLTKPIDTYAMACFFKFTDLAKMASTHAMTIPPNEWSTESRSLMGRSGVRALEGLQNARMEGLRAILSKEVKEDEHSGECVRTGMMKNVWDLKRGEVMANLKLGSELLELLEVDLRGGHCGDCLVLLGATIQESIYQARDLPKST